MTPDASDAAWFALVRHSAYVIAGDARFDEAVEVHPLTREGMYRAKAAGATIFTTREQADADARAINARPAGTRGAFSTARIDGADLFIAIVS